MLFGLFFLVLVALTVAFLVLLVAKKVKKYLVLSVSIFDTTRVLSLLPTVLRRETLD
jgi:hypothetical protein